MRNFWLITSSLKLLDNFQKFISQDWHMNFKYNFTFISFLPSALIIFLPDFLASSSSDDVIILRSGLSPSKSLSTWACISNRHFSFIRLLIDISLIKLNEQKWKINFLVIFWLRLRRYGATTPSMTSIEAQQSIKILIFNFLPKGNLQN